MAIAKMSVAELEKFLHAEFPQAFSGGDIAIESADGASKPETLRRRLNFRERDQEYADLTTFSEGPSPSSLCRHETSALFLLGFG